MCKVKYSKLQLHLYAHSWVHTTQIWSFYLSLFLREIVKVKSVLFPLPSGQLTSVLKYDKSVLFHLNWKVIGWCIACTLYFHPSSILVNCFIWKGKYIIACSCFIYNSREGLFSFSSSYFLAKTFPSPHLSYIFNMLIYVFVYGNSY